VGYALGSGFALFMGLARTKGIAQINNGSSLRRGGAPPHIRRRSRSLKAKLLLCKPAAVALLCAFCAFLRLKSRLNMRTVTAVLGFFLVWGAVSAQARNPVAPKFDQFGKRP
jgi:hypothetical protein